ncbi:MAG TPA: thioredoxin domain-containing protein [Terracidiphilus sp.]|nr:thioredoxin domain-containing protein [Terracidiphilus sp.]
MLRIHVAACLLIVCLAAGCKAQSNPQGPLNPELARRVEVMVRSQFNVPPDFSVTLGERAPSKIEGYDKLPIIFSHAGKSQVIDFLLSTDGSKLARLETFDIEKDPAFNIDVAGRPVVGNPNAKVTVINFDDLECPYCAALYAELFPSTFDRYKDQVRFIFKDFPLDIHPWAMHAAVDADCLARDNGAVYWHYVDYLHRHVDEITGDGRDVKKSFADLDRIARDEATVAKVDSPQLEACIARQDESTVQASLKEGDSLGLQGAPALFINGELIPGALPENQVWMVIDRALRAAGETPPPPPAPSPAAPSVAPAPPGAGR